MYKTVFFVLLSTQLVFAIPPNDKALFDDNNHESRIHKKKQRPCRGRSVTDEQGRTFFDWSIQHVDVNYNYNYNINCGGGGGQHGGGGGLGGGQGGGGIGQKPILSGLLQGSGGGQPGGGLLGGTGPVSFVQQQVQGILANPPSLPSLPSFPSLPNPGSQSSDDGFFSGLGSFFQGGLFNGQGILSLFDNGLFSGIFDNNRPSNPPASNPPIRPPISPPIQPTTPKPDVTDPDDIIYNDEKPVHEDHDDVFPDQYNRPGGYRRQYIVASNPIFGEFVHELPGYGSNFNKNRIVRQFNRDVNRLATSFTDLFGF